MEILANMIYSSSPIKLQERSPKTQPEPSGVGHEHVLSEGEDSGGYCTMLQGIDNALVFLL